jgi:hypothetical protein
VFHFALHAPYSMHRGKTPSCHMQHAQSAACTASYNVYHGQFMRIDVLHAF